MSAAPERTLRVVLLTNIATPYRLPFFNALARRHELIVLFDALSEPNRRWHIDTRDFGFAHEFVRGWQLRYRRSRGDIALDDERYLHLRWDILPRLLRLRPDVVVTCEMGVRTLQALLYARLLRVPLVLWSEGTMHTEGWVGGAKGALRRWLTRGADRFWTNGAESAEFLVRHGAAPGAVDEGMTGVDTGFFQSEVARLRVSKFQIQQELGLRGRVLLFVGQLIPRKGIGPLLGALSRLVAAGRTGWSLLLVGGGELAGEVRAWAGRHPGVTVLCLDHVDKAELPRHYAAADAFVLPTLDDNWSLVTLEAAVSGLPQLYSSLNGASVDLLARGCTGVLADPREEESLEAGLAALLDGRVPAPAAAAVSAVSEHYSPVAQADRAAVSVWRSLDGRDPGVVL